MTIRYRGITRERLAQMQSRRKVLVADVRNPEYFSSGTIQGALNLYPTRKFVNELHRVTSKYQPIVIVGQNKDGSDEDVAASARYAEQLGFENVYVSDFVTLRD